jgi:hypothetical protein
MLAVLGDAPLGVTRGEVSVDEPTRISGPYRLIAVNRVATRVATQAASGVTWRHPAD